MATTTSDVRKMLGRPALTQEAPETKITADERTDYERQIAALQAEVKRLQAELDKATSKAPATDDSTADNVSVRPAKPGEAPPDAINPIVETKPADAAESAKKPTAKKAH
jgi:uncharacterized small protein (DUF1192 family)